MNFDLKYVGPDEETERSIDLASPVAPDLNDTPLRDYRTVGGSHVAVARTNPDEVAYLFCYGCGKRDDVGYGWDDTAMERGNQHAAECRALPSGVR
jgi:hypothetical protein